MNRLKFAGKFDYKLSENAEHAFAERHALNVYKSNSIYSFIPKNACSTLRLSLAVANGVVTDVESQNNWIHSNNSTFSSNLRDLVSADYSFIVLRCPYRRIASTFLDKFVSLTNLSVRFVESQYADFNILDMNFVRFLKNVKRQSDRIRDHHWRTQSAFWVFEEYSDVFSVECFENAVNTLQNKDVLKVVDARPFTNHSVQSMQVKQSDCFSRTSIRVLNAMKRKGALPQYENMYCEEARSLVEDIYREDFVTYEKYFDKHHLLFKKGA